MKGKTGNQFGGILLSAVLVFMLSFPRLSPASSHFIATNALHESPETIVYITKTGTKYHKSSCRYLSQSKIKTSLAKAVAAGMAACKVCKP